MNDEEINQTFYEQLVSNYKKMLHSMIESNKKLEKENYKLGVICTISLLINIIFVLTIAINFISKG